MTQSLSIPRFRRGRRQALQLLGTTAFAWTLADHYARAEAAPVTRAPAQLRIGYQKSAVNLVILKQHGVLEKRFPQTRISWLEFPAGPQLLEALSANSLDFGFTGDAPPVFAQAAGKELHYVGAEPPKPESSAILAPADSPLTRLGDLKGKRIALQRGSSAHYLLVRALDKAGIAWSEIQPIYLAPADARAAFERKSVDAWAIWDPFYAATELAIRPRVLTNGEGLSGNTAFYLASREVVERHPQLIKALFEELTRADHFAQTSRQESVSLIAAFSGLDAHVVSRFIARRPSSPVGLIGPSIVTEQQRVADAFFRLGLIPRQVRVADIVWQPSAAEFARLAAATPANANGPQV